MSDEWDFYFCTVDHKPASIFVDLGIHADAPSQELTEMAYLRLHMLKPRDDGLSSKSEYEQLIKIEDALSDVAGYGKSIVYVGRNTSDECRDFYFYSSNGRIAESALSSAMIPFETYEFETGSRVDADWAVYRKFLYPNDRQRQMIENGRVLANLEKHGDNHQIEREVFHWIYFTSVETRAGFLDSVVKKGFRQIMTNDEGDGDRKFALQVSCTSGVDYTTINNIVLELHDLAIEYNGDYDGWETSVETAP